MKRILLISTFLLLISTSCQTEPEGILEESKSLTESFLKDLRKIHSRQDALKKNKKLRKHYRRFAALMIEAKELEIDNAESFYFQAPNKKSEELRSELKRLYQLQGVGAVLEECQKEALYDLYLSSVVADPKQ